MAACADASHSPPPPESPRPSTRSSSALRAKGSGWSWSSTGWKHSNAPTDRTGSTGCPTSSRPIAVSPCLRRHRRLSNRYGVAGGRNSECPLTVPERRELIAHFLSACSRRLDADQVTRIASAPQTANPLFFTSHLDELHQVVGSFDRNAKACLRRFSSRLLNRFHRRRRGARGFTIRTAFATVLSPDMAIPEPGAE